MCKLKKLSNVKPESDDKEDSALNAEEQAAAATADGGFEDDLPCHVQPHVYAAAVASLPPGWHAHSVRASQQSRCVAISCSGGAACCKAAAKDSVSNHR